MPHASTIRSRPAADCVAGLLLAGLLAASPAARADGDAARGARIHAAQCTGCHAMQVDRDGPRHAGVYGRRAGSVPGYDYSPGMKASSIVWNDRSLDRWLSDPEAMVPGQRMDFRIDDAAQRADLIAYLATLRAPAPARQRAAR